MRAVGLLFFLAACAAGGGRGNERETDRGHDGDDTGDTETGRVDTGDSGTATVPPDADWRLGAGPRFVADEAYDQASYAISVGPIDSAGTQGILVGTPHNATDYTPPPPGPYPWADGAFLLTTPFQGGTIPDEATAIVEGYTEELGTTVGLAVGLVGDITGDGEPDMAVTGSFPDREYLVVMSGPHDAGRSYEDADASFSYDGYFGVPAQTAGGDLDGDGIDDLLLQGGGPEGSGALVLYGPLTGANLFDDNWDLLVHAPADDNPGEPVCAWDQDGDGATDLLVSATWTDEKRGRVYLVSGPGSGSIDASDADAAWEGEHAGDYAGFALASGDLDGDGAADLFVGAPMADDHSGRAYVVLDAMGGALSDSPITFAPRHPYDWLGYAAAVGDFDGDGQDDLAVGAPRDIYNGFDRPGRAAVFLGPLGPGAYDEDSAAAIWMGSEAPDSFGARLLADDLDQDGRDDLVVGAPWDQEVGAEAGSVTLLFGGGLTE